MNRSKMKPGALEALAQLRRLIVDNSMDIDDAIGQVFSEEIAAAVVEKSGSDEDGVRVMQPEFAAMSLGERREAVKIVDGQESRLPNMFK